MVLIKGNEYVSVEGNPHPNAEASRWITSRMKEYEIFFSTTGNIVVKDIDDRFKFMGRNHLKSNLRRDFMQARGPLRGLDKLIDDIIEYKLHIASKSTSAVKETVYGGIET